METIEKVKTTTTLKTTKEELVTLINGLFQVQTIKGKEFSLAVSKNIATLKETLTNVEEAGTPSEAFMKLASTVNEIANKNEDDAKEKIDELEKQNQELVDARRAQMEEVTELLKEEVEIELETLSEDILPEDITAQQINGIIKIIN
jgi:dGTP triphosphohydrolase